MSLPPWLEWLNTAPVAEIERALRAELGDQADTSKSVRRCMVVIYERRAHGEPFDSFEAFSTCKNIGRRSRRLMSLALGRHGYVAACKHCPLHCPNERNAP